MVWFTLDPLNEKKIRRPISSGLQVSKYYQTFSFCFPPDLRSRKDERISNICSRKGFKTAGLHLVNNVAKIRKKHFQWKRIHHFQVQTCEVKIQKLFANLEQKRRMKRKSPPAQYLRISIGCRKGSRCGQNFHKKSGCTGRILNIYIYQSKQTLGSSRPSAAGPKCTPGPNKA